MIVFQQNHNFFIAFDQDQSFFIFAQQELILIKYKLLKSQYKQKTAPMRNQKKYAEKTEKPSRVLLVCVYDTVVIDITPQIVRAKFEQFGYISKLLIFEKGQVTKLFIQYQQINQALKAKTKLDGTKLYDSICKMSIYYSNFSNVEVANQTEDKNYSDYAYENSYKSPIQYVQAPQRIQNNYMAFDDDYIMNSFNPFGDFHRSRTESDNTLKYHIQNSMYQEKNYSTNSQYKYQRPIANSFQNNWQLKKEEEPVVKIKQEVEIRSSILWFNYKFPIKPKHVYNLFSNFGNISIITVKKEQVYIKFRSKQFAAMSNTYLNGLVLLDNNLELRQCPQDSTCWKLNQGQFSQSSYFDSTFDRFTSQRSITINPPANTIHVSSIKKEICREKNLRQIFSKYGKIQRVQILQNSTDKNMALIKFSTMEDSFSAIANVHNEAFGGRKIQISFTKSKV